MRAPIGPEVLARKKLGVLLGRELTGAVDGGEEERVPLLELGADGERLRRRHDAGEEVHLAPLDHLLRLAHAVGGVALRVLEEEFHLAAEDAAALVDFLLDELARRTTCAPSAAHVPVMAVGTPMRMGPLPCAHARSRSGGAAKTPAAAAPVTRNCRLPM